MLRELRSAVYAESNVSQPPEYGVYGTKTPGEVAQDRRPDARDLEDGTSRSRNSALEQRIRQAESRAERADQNRDAGRDR